MRQTLFVSYNRIDVKWWGELAKSLSAYAYNDELDVWSDNRIPISTEWEEQIEKAITEARVALLIITPDFFRSEYIANKELLRIFEQHSHRGLDIWPIPFKETVPEVREIHGLSKIEWPRSPDQPLSGLRPERRMLALDQICGKLVRGLGLLGHTSKTTRDAFGQFLAASPRWEFSDPVPIASGDVSIVYKAQWKKNKVFVAIKAILPSMRREWVADEFARRAEACMKLRDSRFMVRTHEVIRDDKRNLSYAIMELLESWDTLDNHLRQFPKGLEARYVAGILAQLAYAASELQKVDSDAEGRPLLLGPLRPKNVFVSDGEVRVSPLRISGATLRSCRGRPTTVLDDGELTYLTPEQFFGDESVKASDQYYLGLLGVELLRGKPVGEVGRFADLLEKQRFFDAPAASLDGILEVEPALFFVLARMLESKPEARWPDAKSLGLALEEVSRGRVPPEVRREALKSYSECLMDDWRFYQRFYEIFCHKNELAKAMFKDKDMQKQHSLLNKALVEVLNFVPDYEPTTLTYLRSHKKHRDLTEVEYRQFKEAFLEALAELDPPPSHFTKAAWGAVFDAAIAYMAGSGGRAR